MRQILPCLMLLATVLSAAGCGSNSSTELQHARAEAEKAKRELAELRSKERTQGVPAKTNGAIAGSTSGDSHRSDRPSGPASPSNPLRPDPSAKAEQATARRRMEEEASAKAEQDKAAILQAEAAKRKRQRQDELTKPSLERPAFWHTTGSDAKGLLGALLAVGTLNPYELEKVKRRTLPKGLVEPELRLWSDALSQKGIVITNENNEFSKALILYFGLLDGLHENEVFQAPTSERYRARIGRLPESAINAWHTALTALAGKQVKRVETVLYVIQFEAMFDGPDRLDFDMRNSEELIQRLKSIDSDAVDEWAELIDSFKVPAALSLMQKDCLFNQAVFQKEDFRTMAEAAKKIFPKREIPKDRLRKIDAATQKTFPKRENAKGKMDRIGKPNETEKPKAQKPKPPEVDREKTAAGKLKLAKVLLKTNLRAGKKRLEEIIKDFDGTAAAKEANELLNAQ